MTLRDFLPALVALVLLGAALWVTDRALRRRSRPSQFARQGVLLIATLAGIMVVLLLLPDELADDQSVLQLMGLAVTVVLTLGSTTLVTNTMAGLMLRSVGSFEVGDFIRVGEHFGRVSERGLFHTEIQTETRDLTTLPNQFLVGTPVTVARPSGTVVATQLSLGYDAAHHHVEPLLLEAAERSGLTQPFVQILELGDSAITYRVAGLLDDLSRLFTAPSRLRRRVLDTLHAARIEVASPRLVAHRQMSDEVFVVPQGEAPPERFAEDEESSAPQEVIFDKAEGAAAVARLRAELEAARETVKALEQESRKATEEARVGIHARLDESRSRVVELESRLRELDDGGARG